MFDWFSCFTVPFSLFFFFFFPSSLANFRWDLPALVFNNCKKNCKHIYVATSFY